MGFADSPAPGGRSPGLAPGGRDGGDAGPPFSLDSTRTSWAARLLTACFGKSPSVWGISRGQTSTPERSKKSTRGRGDEVRTPGAGGRNGRPRDTGGVVGPRSLRRSAGTWCHTARRIPAREDDCNRRWSCRGSPSLDFVRRRRREQAVEGQQGLVIGHPRRLRVGEAEVGAVRSDPDEHLGPGPAVGQSGSDEGQAKEAPPQASLTPSCSCRSSSLHRAEPRLERASDCRDRRPDGCRSVYPRSGPRQIP